MSTITLDITLAGNDITITITTREKEGSAPSPVIVPQIAQTASFDRSSFLDSATYDHEARALDITMKTGKAYRYFEVEPWVFESLILSESAGQFYTYEIKPNYTCQKL
jgi:hypothetical protein